MKIYPCSITGYWSCEEFFLSFFSFSFLKHYYAAYYFFFALLWLDIFFTRIFLYDTKLGYYYATKLGVLESLFPRDKSCDLWRNDMFFFLFFFSFSLFEARNTLCLGVFTVYVGLRKLLLCVTCFISLDLFHDIETDVVSKEIRTASLLKIK